MLHSKTSKSFAHTFIGATTDDAYVIAFKNCSFNCITIFNTHGTKKFALCIYQNGTICQNSINIKDEGVNIL